MTPDRARQLTLSAWDVALRAGVPVTGEVREVLTGLALDAPRCAAGLPRVLGALHPEVREVVRRLGVAEVESRASQGAVSGRVSTTGPGRPTVGVPEAARALRLSPHGVRSACRRKTLPATKDEAGEWVISRDDVIAYGRAHWRI